MASQAVVFARAISTLCGWLYFLAWSFSFYPQLILNWRRKSTQGFEIDFPLCNILGYIAYTASTSSFLFSDLIKHQYAARHPRSPTPTVTPEDLAFAAHALVLSLVVYSQFWSKLWGFETLSFIQKPSRVVLGIFWGCITGVLLVICIVASTSPNGGHDPSGYAWIDVVYALGYVKLIVTVVKYIPQGWSNYRRKSTTGWDINQILMDISGALLSLLQLVIDSSLQNDWSGLTGNPVKFGLSNITIIFDVFFITQHYLLYRPRSTSESGADEERRVLIRPHSAP